MVGLVVNVPPFLMARTRNRRTFAQGSLWGGAAPGALGGAILAVPLAVILDTLGGVLNLPEGFDWVAFALLILGLPIVLATAFLAGGVPRGAGTGDTNPHSRPQSDSPSRFILVQSFDEELKRLVPN